MDYTEDHEKLMSPRKWTTRLSPDDLVTTFHKLGEEATLRSRKHTRCEVDIPYGPSDFEKYDVYGTDLPNDAPIFAFLHGGYWQLPYINKDVSAFAAESFVPAGIKVICIDHDFCPNVTLHEIVRQMKTATNKILQYAAESGSRGVWMSGHCAGAYLALALLDPEWFENEPNSSLLKGLVLLSGIFFLEPLITCSVNDKVKLDRNQAKLMSNLSKEFKAPVKDLRVIVAVAEHESPEFIKQAREVTERLCRIVDDVEYVLVRNGIDHFNLVENLVDENFPITKRIIKHINFHSV